MDVVPVQLAGEGIRAGHSWQDETQRSEARRRRCDHRGPSGSRSSAGTRSNLHLIPRPRWRAVPPVPRRSLAPLPMPRSRLPDSGAACSDARTCASAGSTATTVQAARLVGGAQQRLAAVPGGREGLEPLHRPGPKTRA